MRICSAKGNGWACERTSDRHAFTKGMCRTHYTQVQRGKALSRIQRTSTTDGSHRSCRFDSCQRAALAKGLCNGHYQQHSTGRPLAPLRRKRDNATYQAMVESGFVECLECGVSKPTSEYSTGRQKNALRPYCKPCNSVRVRLSHYDVTKEFLDQLWRFQGERCAICGTAETGMRAPHIDHDHACCKLGEELRRMRTWSRLLELQCLRACLVRSPSGPPTQLRSAGCLPRRAAREAVPAGTAHCGRGVGRRSIDRGPVPHGLLAREVRHILVQRRRRVLVDAPLRLDAWLARRDVVGDPEAVAGK